MREDVLPDVPADPAERESLGLVDGHREATRIGAASLELEGAHVVRREHLVMATSWPFMGPWSTLASHFNFS